MKIISIALATAVAGLLPLLLPELPQQEGRGIKKIVVPSGSVSVPAVRQSAPAILPEIPAELSAGIPAAPSNDHSTDAAVGGTNLQHIPIFREEAELRHEDTVQMKWRITRDSVQSRPVAPPDDGRRTSFPLLAVDIPRIGMVELGTDDLARLGITVDEEGIIAAWQEEGKQEPFIMGFATGGVLTPSRAGRENISDVMPAAVTDDVGGYRALIYDETEQEKALLEELRNGANADGSEVEQRVDAMQERHESRTRDAMQIGRLVPVLVRTGRVFTAEDGLAGRFRPDCIFWYEPGRKFLDRLPADVRERVEKEMNLAGRLSDAGHAPDAESPNLRSAIASDVMATVGESPYLDVLRSAGGAIMETGIEPNPAREHTTLTYRLAAPRAISLSLHDISGRRLRELAPARFADAGMGRVGLELRGTPRGIYLVVISTDRGERAVQRLIVER